MIIPMAKTALLLTFLFLFTLPLYTQDVVKVVTLKSVDIQAVEDDFDTEAFIKMVKADSTFYLAFKAMNYYPATYSGWLKVYKKGEKEKGHVNRKAERFRSDNLMWVEILEEEVKGKIQKKNGNYKYLTAETWDDVFFPSEKRKVNMKGQNDFEKEKGLSKTEKHKMEIKKMMFNPGIEVEGVPFVGDKMGIFDDIMHKYYSYSVYTSHYKDTIKCLVFEAEIDPKYKKGKTVIKSLSTYFDQETFQVMKREINLEFYSLFIDFNIFIKVENQIFNNVLLPEKIYYKGFFDIPFMKKEEVEFLLEDFNYLF